ncbi:MAG: N-acylglucosamine 2-epimerase [Frankiales bacterium]|jgi:N-acylglucosamine 2-epimerase|nr:N-acylglucosamine 2-epimerase [Frankiales bacterium]
MPQTAEGLHEFYRRLVVEDLLQFWTAAIDTRHGGVFTSFNNAGTMLVSTDKYTWSQGRFAWLTARLSEMAGKGLIDADPDELLEQSRRTVEFLLDHAFLPDGHCAFVLTAEGEPKEAFPDSGLDPSIWADSFVIMGLSEFARVAKSLPIAERALDAYDGVRTRIRSGVFRTEPYPFPPEYRPFSVPMGMLNLAQELAHGLRACHHSRAAEVEADADELAAELLASYVEEGNSVTELVPRHPADADSLLARHVNPGHVIECMWFVLHQLRRGADKPSMLRAAAVIKESVRLGWDSDYGGLLRYVDRLGGEPQGALAGGRYEELVRDTWSMKLWWPHSEALYALLLAWELTSDSELLDLYWRVHEYTFATFPNPDATVREWIQIRDRQGRPDDRVVALPVKDPYHILRDAMLIIELTALGGVPS